MGIPFYFSYLIKTHRNILQKYSKTSFPIDNLFIDANPLIYNAINQFSKDSDIISNVIEQINELVLKLSPKKRIYIAFDGVAPVSKLEQQRGRRYKKRYEVIDGESIHKFNSVNITPGTPFMLQLNSTLEMYYYSGNSSTQDMLSVNEIIYNGPNEIGEGEHKIFSFIRNHKTDIAEDVNVIYGLDADLIMLCLNHLKISRNIYLFRETPHFIQSIDNTLVPNETYILDIYALSETIHQQINMTPEDYIVMCFLLGNDFLPHFPSINIRTGGITKLIDAFKEMPIGFTFIDPTSKNIQWNNLKQYIENLAHKEASFLQEEIKQRDKTQKYYYTSSSNKNDAESREELNKKLSALPTYERELERSINPFKPGWQLRYYSALFNLKNTSRVTAQFKQSACENYLYGLEWTYKYYTGDCPDWRWKYQHFYPPLLEDLVSSIPTENSHQFIPDDMVSTPISSTTQLCYVLPTEYLNLIPVWIKEPLLTEHPEWYSGTGEGGDEDEVEFIWAFCKYFWEAHPILPEIPVDELERFIKSVLERDV